MTKLYLQPYLKEDFDFYKVVSDWVTFKEGNRILKILKDNGIEVVIR